MNLRTLPLQIRGSVNSGVLVGTAFAETENDKKNTTTRGRIIGAAVAAVILIVIIASVTCYDRSKKRKAKGTRLRDTGAVEANEEARPMYQGPVGVPRPSMMQPEGTYFPPQGAGMYAGSAYGQVPMHIPAGQNGAEFYRNQ